MSSIHAPLASSLAAAAFLSCGGTSGGGTAAVPNSCPAGTQVVIASGRVGPYGAPPSFNPASLTVHVGDTVCWYFADGGHQVVSGTSCTADSRFCSPNDMNCSTVATSLGGANYTHKFTAAGTYPYFCSVHCAMGMIGTVTVQ